MFASSVFHATAPSVIGKCFSKRSSYLAIAAIVLVSSFCFAAKTREKDLPERYRKWLERDVTYLITGEEKQAFLELGNDQARDVFIERFWEIRNPAPGAPTNPYKEDIYRRLEYANQWFGKESGTEGWRTDMGKVYIELGPPQQRATYLSAANVRPMEIWFYSRPHPALPPFFYVVFYQREAGGAFRLYSPYMDGPTKLISSASTEGDRTASLTVIDKQLGREVARTILTLLPDEPVDMQGATTSLQSDVLLATIRGLANNPVNKDLLAQRRRLLEDVSHRIIVGGEYLDVLTVPLRDPSGAWNLHYVLRFKKPEDFTITQANDSRYYYSAEVSARVSDVNGKLIFEQRRKLSAFVEPAKLETTKNKVFGYEGLLPLAPGKYKIEFLLVNEGRKSAFRNEREVVIPDAPASGLRISDVVPFSEAASAQPMLAPFTIAGVKFTPTSSAISLVPGQDLKFFYQIWAPAADAKSYGVSKLSAEYAYGRMGLHDTKTVQDEFPKSQFDANGAMVNGKKISTADLGAGNYRLSVTVNDPDTRARAFANFQFRVADNEPSTPAWDVSDPQLTAEVGNGILDFDRALCYEAQGDMAAAASLLRNAFRRNHGDENIRAKLVEIYYRQKDFSQIANIYSLSGVTAQTDEQTVLRIAESLDKVGDLRKSIQFLESAIAVKPKSGPLYLALAGYYQRSGNTDRANETERKGKELIAANPSTS